MRSQRCGYWKHVPEVIVRLTAVVDVQDVCVHLLAELVNASKVVEERHDQSVMKPGRERKPENLTTRVMPASSSKEPV